MNHIVKDLWDGSVGAELKMKLRQYEVRPSAMGTMLKQIDRDIAAGADPEAALRAACDMLISRANLPAYVPKSAKKNCKDKYAEQTKQLGAMLRALG